MDQEYLFGLPALMEIVLVCIGLLAYVPMIVAEWRILVKAGEKGWKSLIPFYNIFISHHIAGMRHIWFILEMIFWVIEVVFEIFDPGIDWLTLLVSIPTTIFTIASEWVHICKLCRCFGKSRGFTIGMMLIPNVFTVILAFDKSIYTKPSHTDDAVCEDPAVEKSPERRKTEINMLTISRGIVLFGVWTLVKLGLLFLLIVQTTFDDTDDLSLLLALTFVFFVIILIDFLTRAYIAYSVYADVKGKHKTIAYLIFLGFVLLLSAFVIVLNLLYMTLSISSILDAIIMLVVDGTSFILLLELLINGIRLRVMRRNEKRKAEEEHAV